MSDLFQTTEDRLGADLEALANPVRTIEEIHEQADRTWRHGKDPMSSVQPKEQRAKPVSHTTRTRDWWEDRGYIYTIVEYRDVYSQGGISGVGAKHDLWGSIDALVIKGSAPFEPPIALQNTSVGELANHVRNKICGRDTDKKSGRARIDCSKAWLGCGGRILLQAWGPREEVDRFLDSQRYYKVVESYRNRPVRANTKWFAVVIELDLAIIEGVESRRRT